MKCLLPLVLVLCASPVLAGLWDRDRPENDHLPGELEVITGRFDRPTPEYYGRRIALLEGTLDDTGDLHAFRDAAVAHFRLGAYTEAIILVDRSVPLIQQLRADHPAVARRHRLQATANKAAFLMHRWLAANVTDQSNLREARRLLLETLEVDPYEADARSSLIEINWLLANPRWVQGADPVFPNLLDLTDASFTGDLGAVAIARNDLTGCMPWLVRRIIYEDGWSNVDVMYAYSLLLALNDQPEEAMLAYFRVVELLDAGRTTRVANAPVARALKRLMGTHVAHLPDQDAAQKVYLEMRRQSDQWLDSRNVYASAQLKAGQHPDRDPAFWTGWRPHDPPPQPGVVIEPKEPIVSTTLLIGGIGGLFVIMLIMLVATLMLGRKAAPHPSVDEV